MLKWSWMEETNSLRSMNIILKKKKKISVLEPTVIPKLCSLLTSIHPKLSSILPFKDGLVPLTLTRL